MCPTPLRSHDVPGAMPIGWPYTPEAQPFWEAWLGCCLEKRGKSPGLASRMGLVPMAHSLGYRGDVPRMMVAFLEDWRGGQPRVPAHPSFAEAGVDRAS
ncbi:MAG: hypothetical protein ACE5NA_00155 [Nitrospiraceae bacterium]